MESTSTSPPALGCMTPLGVDVEVEDGALALGAVDDADPPEVGEAGASMVAEELLLLEVVASEEEAVDDVDGAPDPDVGIDAFPDTPSEVEEVSADKVDGSMKLAVVTGKVNTEIEDGAAPVPFGSFGLIIVKMPP